MESDRDGIHVPWDIIAWQNEALMLPIEQVRDKAVENLNILSGMLSNLNVLAGSDHQENFQNELCDEVVETTLVAVLMTAVSAAIYILGAAQRNPDGVRIISPVAPQMN